MNFKDILALSFIASLRGESFGWADSKLQPSELHSAYPHDHYDKSLPIHPEYDLKKIKHGKQGSAKYEEDHNWEVVHTPTNKVVGEMSIQAPTRAKGSRQSFTKGGKVGTQRQKFHSVISSSVGSPYHKNIGELAYAKLIGHYGHLTSDHRGVTSNRAAKTWKSLGGRELKLRHNHLDRSNFVKKAEKGSSLFSSHLFDFCR